MILLLARHADAGVADASRWPDDSDRPLTEQGRAIQQKVSEALRRAKLCPDVVLSSPLLRARQTAHIIAEVCQVAAPPLICDALAAPPALRAVSEALREALSAAPGREIYALTGHSPWLDKLASLVLAGTSGGLRMEFAKSAVMVIRADSIAPGAGVLVHFLQPGIAEG